MTELRVHFLFYCGWFPPATPPTTPPRAMSYALITSHRFMVDFHSKTDAGPNQVNVEPMAVSFSLRVVDRRSLFTRRWISPRFALPPVASKVPTQRMESSRNNYARLGCCVSLSLRLSFSLSLSLLPVVNCILTGRNGPSSIVDRTFFSRFISHISSSG